MSFLHATCCSVPKLVNNVKISRFTPRKLENFPMKNVELFNKTFKSENCFSRKLQIEFSRSQFFIFHEVLVFVPHFSTHRLMNFFSAATV